MHLQRGSLRLLAAGQASLESDAFVIPACTLCRRRTSNWHLESKGVQNCKLLDSLLFIDITKLLYLLAKSGAPEEIRTPAPQIVV